MKLSKLAINERILVTRWNKEGVYRYSGLRFQRVFRSQVAADNYIKRLGETAIKENLVTRTILWE